MSNKEINFCSLHVRKMINLYTARMSWKDLEDALEVLETEREYDEYFCSIKVE